MKALILITVHVLFVCQSIFSQSSTNCSIISLMSGDTVVLGRNHDVTIPNGLLVFNPRNIHKEGFEFPDEDIPRWTSKYSSITLNVFGVGFAICGMNEKGLSMGHVGFADAKYPSAKGTPVIDQIHFITYMLDNFTNTHEVVSAVNEISISEESITREHYYVCDAIGRTAILEPIEGEWVIFTNETMPYPIISNDNYEQSIDYLKDYQGFGGNRIIPERNFGVEEIMAMGATYLQDFQNHKNQHVVKSAFELLHNIGFNKFPPPEHVDVPQNYGTHITTVFDLKNLIVYFRTKSYPEIKMVRFDQFNPDCPDPIMMMEVETDKVGNVSNSFENFTFEKNLHFVNERLKNDVPGDIIELLGSYPETFKCK